MQNTSLWSISHHFLNVLVHECKDLMLICFVYFRARLCFFIIFSFLLSLAIYGFSSFFLLGIFSPYCKSYLFREKKLILHSSDTGNLSSSCWLLISYVVYFTYSRFLFLYSWTSYPLWLLHVLLCTGNISYLKNRVIHLSCLLTCIYCIFIFQPSRHMKLFKCTV